MSTHFLRDKPMHRKLKVLTIQADLLLEFWRGIRGDTLYRFSGVPNDARVVGLSVDTGYNDIKLYLESKKFEEVPSNMPIPELSLVCHTRSPRMGENGELIFEPVDY